MSELQSWADFCGWMGSQPGVKEFKTLPSNETAGHLILKIKFSDGTNWESYKYPSLHALLSDSAQITARIMHFTVALTENIPVEPGPTAAVSTYDWRCKEWAEKIVAEAESMEREPVKHICTQIQQLEQSICDGFARIGEAIERSLQNGK